MSTKLPTYEVLMLGARGSGKTVFLASLYKQLATQAEHGFFLDVDSLANQKRLNRIYAQLAKEGEWPPATKPSEVSEWTFTCRVQTQGLSIYPACRFTYLDYSGGRLTDVLEEMGSPLSNFELKLEQADALLCLLDGHKIATLMGGASADQTFELVDIPNMLHIMQNTERAIHFVISKWDLLDGRFTLRQIRERLYKIPEFSNIVTSRVKAGIPIRLIPISSVGMNFATPQPDGSMKKIAGAVPRPFHVEAPLACILPDAVKIQLDRLIEDKQALIESIIQVKPNLSPWDKLKDFFAHGIQFAYEFLPEKYQFGGNVLQKLTDYLKSDVQKKEQEAYKRTEELRREQEISMMAVEDEVTAMNHVVNSFMRIQSTMDQNFPDSDLRRL
jgi:hypothetical protein